MSFLVTVVFPVVGWVAVRDHLKPFESALIFILVCVVVLLFLAGERLFRTVEELKRFPGKIDFELYRADPRSGVLVLKNWGNKSLEDVGAFVNFIDGEEVSSEIDVRLPASGGYYRWNNGMTAEVPVWQRSESTDFDRGRIVSVHIGGAATAKPVEQDEKIHTFHIVVAADGAESVGFTIRLWWDGEKIMSECHQDPSVTDPDIGQARFWQKKAQ